MEISFEKKKWGKQERKIKREKKAERKKKKQKKNKQSIGKID